MIQHGDCVCITITVSDFKILLRPLNHRVKTQSLSACGCILRVVTIWALKEPMLVLPNAHSYR